MNATTKRVNAYDGVRQIIADNPLEGLQTVLESLVDKFGNAKLLAHLAEVAEAKADHILSNWQDENLAQRWEATAKKLAELGHNLPTE